MNSVSKIHFPENVIGIQPSAISLLNHVAKKPPILILRLNVCSKFFTLHYTGPIGLADMIDCPLKGQNEIIITIFAHDLLWVVEFIVLISYIYSWIEHWAHISFSCVTFSFTRAQFHSIWNFYFFSFFCIASHVIVTSIHDKI